MRGGLVVAHSHQLGFVGMVEDAVVSSADEALLMDREPELGHRKGFFVRDEKPHKWQ